MSEEKLFDDIVERELFIDLVAKGTPPDLAGIEVGWTPRRTKLNMADPDFRELIRMAQDRSLDSVELALFELATKGKNLGAMQMVLYNKRPEQWRDVRRIEVNNTHELSPTGIAAAVAAAKQLMLDVGPQALQPGGGLDPRAIEATSTEEPGEAA